MLYHNLANYSMFCCLFCELKNYLIVILRTLDCLAIKGAKNIKHLDLTRNALSQLDYEQWEDLSILLSAGSIKSLDLRGNNLHQLYNQGVLELTKTLFKKDEQLKTYLEALSDCMKNQIKLAIKAIAHCQSVNLSCNSLK